MIALLGILAVAGSLHAQDDSETVRFAVIGDYGIAGKNLQEVADMIKSWQPDFIVTTGDNNYEEGAADTIDANIGQYFHDYIGDYKGSYGEGSETNRFFPVLGNHDYMTDKAQPYFDYFTLPGNERYYDFTEGPVHFFMLNSNPQEPDGYTADSVQAAWLLTTMAESTSPWKIVVLHHAPYSSGERHGPTVALQWPYKDWGADAVLAGHEHVYERLEVEGIPYFVNGIGGDSRRKFGTIDPNSQMRFRDEHGAMLVTASADQILFEFYSTDDGGTLIDSYGMNADGTAVAPALPLAVAAVLETTPVPNDGDAADDVAIWLHPTDLTQSVIIGTDKKGGLGVYDLAGQELQYLPDGQMNNVDLRYGFPLGGQSVALIAVSNRTDDSLSFYTIDPGTRQLAHVNSRTVPVENREAYGLCMYHSLETGAYYVFVNDDKGNVEQWEVFDDGTGRVDAKLVRDFDVGSQAEGCVADDLYGAFYIGEEDVALWKYAAEPAGGEERVQVDVVGGGHLEADIEGLAIYNLPGGEGYLIASSQGSDSYAVYERTGENAYLGSFNIARSDTIDEVKGTDGIEVTNAALNDTFGQGLFVAQDGKNDDGNTNFKLVPWEEVAAPLKLEVDTTWDARAGDPGTP